jgi:hypothetical protein
VFYFPVFSDTINLDMHKLANLTDRQIPSVEVFDSLMGCDLGNICAKAER